MPETTEKKEKSKATSTTTKNKIFKVKVDHPYLIIRTGPGKNFDKTGEYTGVGEFEIKEVKKGEGSKAGWGKLKSGEGWISMDYAERI